MRFLSESERQHLRDLIQSHAEKTGCTAGPDPRGEQDDRHLVFEALHVLANGIPERLFALLYPKGRHSHLPANAGKTMLFFHKIAEQGAACE